MHCNECKYWDKNKLDSEFYEERSGLGECIKPKPFWNCTEWVKDERKLKEANKNDLMFVQDGSDYSAHLWTNPKFGCICFEQK